MQMIIVIFFPRCTHSPKYHSNFTSSKPVPTLLGFAPSVQAQLIPYWLYQVSQDYISFRNESLYLVVFIWGHILSGCIRLRLG